MKKKSGERCEGEEAKAREEIADLRRNKEWKLQRRERGKDVKETTVYGARRKGNKSERQGREKRRRRNDRTRRGEKKEKK